MITKPGTKLHLRHILFPHLTRCGRSAYNILITQNEKAATCKLCLNGLSWKDVKHG